MLVWLGETRLSGRAGEESLGGDDMSSHPHGVPKILRVYVRRNKKGESDELAIKKGIMLGSFSIIRSMLVRREGMKKCLDS
jgi:hypothetical protein